MQGPDAVLERNGGGGVSIRRRWTRRGISYSYDAFGRLVAKAGRRAGFFRYRFYHQGLMRWLNRDPIEEDGGENLYAMCENSPCDSFDELGLWVATKESAGKSRRVYQVERGGCHRVSGRNIYHCGWQSDARCRTSNLENVQEGGLTTKVRFGKLLGVRRHCGGKKRKGIQEICT